MSNATRYVKNLIQDQTYMRAVCQGTSFIDLKNFSWLIKFQLAYKSYLYLSVAHNYTFYWLCDIIRIPRIPFAT